MNDLDLFSEPPRGSRGRGGRGAQRTARKRQRRRRVNGRAAALFALAFLVAVVGGGGLLGYAYLDDLVNPPDYEGAGSGSVVVQIHEGDSVARMGVRLQEHNVIKDERAFNKLALREPRSSSIQPGFYQMRLRMSAKSALDLLLDPKAVSGNQIIIPEGRRVSQVIVELSKKTGVPKAEYEKVVRSPAKLGLPDYANGKVEGYLFPGRYDLDPKGTATTHLKQMVDRYKQVTEAMDLENRARQMKTTPAKVIAMASIIQAESGKAEDMPKISRVIYNRFAKNMQLQMDSTVMYALNKFGLHASSSELNVQSPYNTYRNHGLPPGAISNPGEKAIKAVFEPATGPWVYFVTTDPDQGITEFATTQAEHDRLVAKYNEWRRKRGGG
ncbi:endolytic transglycosylase MltG [Actinomadura craniellae]|uniref:Endolytic murein transglycosylase n=1 Tax=Actinomadura craniellae TaxID=2231787 RepID=A0A365HDV4_9ACTN|nr:endolytic transglycosylase MltG [Actinomadura craniellae]RAY17229.1 endolytic transglycosylase MltG [Actinomadura craniellae]